MEKPKRLGRGLEDISPIFLSAKGAFPQGQQTSAASVQNRVLFASRTHSIAVTATPSLTVEKSFLSANLVYEACKFRPSIFIDIDPLLIHPGIFLESHPKDYAGISWEYVRLLNSHFEKQGIGICSVLSCPHPLSLIQYTGSMSFLKEKTMTFEPGVCGVFFNLPVLSAFDTQGWGALASRLLVLLRPQQRDSVQACRFARTFLSENPGADVWFLFISEDAQEKAPVVFSKIQADMGRSCMQNNIHSLGAHSFTKDILDSLVIKKPVSSYRQDLRFSEMAKETGLTGRKPGVSSAVPCAGS